MFFKIIFGKDIKVDYICQDKKEKYIYDLFLIDVEADGTIPGK